MHRLRPGKELLGVRVRFFMTFLFVENQNEISLKMYCTNFRLNNHGG